MKTQNKVILVSMVSSIATGTIAGFTMGSGNQHGENALSGASMGLFAGLLLSIPFALIFKDADAVTSGLYLE
jgi:hypothetical protein